MKFFMVAVVFLVCWTSILIYSVYEQHKAQVYACSDLKPNTPTDVVKQCERLTRKGNR